MDKFFIRIAAVILVAGLVLAGCSNPAGNEEPGPGGPDTTALAAAIEAAKTTRDSVRAAGENEDADDVPLGLSWATPAQITTFNAAIAAAEAAKTSATTQTAVNAAVTTLNAAVEVFTTAVNSNGPGTKTEGFDQDDLTALIAQAKTAKTGVVTSDDGEDVPPTGVWVTQTQWDTLTSAISTAEASPADSNAVYLALSAALTAFNYAKAPGVTPVKSGLFAAIESAGEARTGVAIAASAAGAPLDSEWVTQVQWDALDTVYTASVSTANNQNAAKNDVDAAASALSSAVSIFNSAKSANGLGTATSKITITGLLAIYDNGDEVYIELSEDEDFDEHNVPHATLTDGSLVYDPGSVTGSYYLGFTTNEILAFVSTQKISLTGVPVTLSYPGDFKVLACRFTLDEFGFSGSGNMTLDQMFHHMVRVNYSTYLSLAKEQMIEYLKDNPKLHSLVDVAFYKDKDFTQPYKSTDTVNAATVVYTKVTMEDGVLEDRGEQIGAISGSITLTNIPSPRPEVYISASGDGPGYDWSSYSSMIDLSGVSGNSETVNWTIPLYENDIYNGDWSSVTGNQTVNFELRFREGHSGDDFGISLGSKTLDMTNKNISAGSLDTANLATVTLSGTISLTLSGTPAASVPRVYICVGTTQIGLIASTRLTMPVNANTPWSITIPAFTSPTDVLIGIAGQDSNYETVFTKQVTTVSNVSTTNVSSITINQTISLITLSGTITYTGSPAPSMVYIEAQGGGHTGHVTIDSPASGASWSLPIAAFDTSTSVSFFVYAEDSSGNNLFWGDNLSPTNVYNSNVQNIILALGDITPSP
jgi:hypothetical protein